MLHPTTLPEFQQILKDHKIVITDAFATWCPPCKWIAPKYEFLDENYGVKKYEDVQFVKIDVDQSRDIAQYLQISAMPTFVIFVQGKERERVRGASYGELKRKIEEVMQSVLGEQMFKAIENDPHDQAGVGGGVSVLRYLILALVVFYFISQLFTKRI